MSQYQSQDDGTGATPPPNTYVVWGEVVGVKKGRVYGLGSEASSATPARRSRSQSQSEPETSEDLGQMRNELAETRERMRLEQEAAREREERLRLEQEAAREREVGLRLELDAVRQEQEAWRRDQDERYSRLERLMMSMATGRGSPLPLTRDDILPPPSSRPSSSGSSRGTRGGRGRGTGGRS